MDTELPDPFSEAQVMTMIEWFEIQTKIADELAKRWKASGCDHPIDFDDMVARS